MLFTSNIWTDSAICWTETVLHPAASWRPGTTWSARSYSGTPDLCRHVQQSTCGQVLPPELLQRSHQCSPSGGHGGLTATRFKIRHNKFYFYFYFKPRGLFKLMSKVQHEDQTHSFSPSCCCPPVPAGGAHAHRKRTFTC